MMPVESPTANRGGPRKVERQTAIGGWGGGLAHTLLSLEASKYEVATLGVKIKNIMLGFNRTSFKEHFYCLKKNYRRRRLCHRYFGVALALVLWGRFVLGFFCFLLSVSSFS